MLRHNGRKRTFNHNLRLAILLSATAGIINVAGFIAFAIFTTNVTGHVAQAAKEVSDGNYYLAQIIALWMLLFFLGAFFRAYLSILFKNGQRLFLIQFLYLLKPLSCYL